MSTAGQPQRRTLPAPAPIEIEELRADLDRVRLENETLKEQLRSRETSAREITTMFEEINRLRGELAALRDSRRLDPPIPGRPLLPAIDLAPSFEPAPTGGPVPTAGTPASGGVDFGTVSRLGPAELDGLPYGLICLDAQGRVVHYNDTESRLARLPKDRVVGRNVFADVAPCTRVREFEGEFFDLVRDPSRVRVKSFDFVFRFGHSEQHVSIVLTPARVRGLYNMALLRRSVVAR